MKKLFSIMWNKQTRYHSKLDFQNVDQLQRNNKG